MQTTYLPPAIQLRCFSRGTFIKFHYSRIIYAVYYLIALYLLIEVKLLPVFCHNVVVLFILDVKPRFAKGINYRVQ